MTAPVTVYSTPTCPWCDRAKDYLRSNNVPFVEKDVASDYDAAMEMVRRSGQQGVPVITTEDEVILGFDQQRLARLAQRHGGPKRPPLGLLGADAEQYLAKHPEIASGLPEGTRGVFVGEVRKGSVAERAKLQHGDIVQAVAGKRVRDLTGLDQLIQTMKAGESVSVRYVRNGTDHTTEFRFSYHPADDSIAARGLLDHLTNLEALERIAVALALGSAIGLEREWRNKAAGIRTYALVCQGAALFMLASLLLGEQMVAEQRQYDPSRIASTVVQGVGFIAGGVIFAHGTKVKGLTTASGIWVTAAIGLLIGAGFYAVALIGTAASIFVLVPMHWIERQMLVKNSRPDHGDRQDPENAELIDEATPR